MTSSSNRHPIPTTKSPGRRKLSFAAGLASLTLGVGLTAAAPEFSSEGRDDAEATDGQRHAARLRASNPFARAAGRQAICSFAPGTRMAYAVHSETEVAIDFSKLEGDVDAGPHGQAQIAGSEAEAHHVERDWTLELEALALDEDGASVLAARIHERKTTIEAGAGEQVPTPSAQLDDTFLIRLDARCSIREFGWRSAGDLDAAREQQVMVAGLGFVAPVEPSRSASYGGVGFDATGRYTAAYQYEQDGTVHGQAQSYAIGSGSVQRGAPVGLEVLSSSIEAQLAADAWFETLLNQRDLVMTFSGHEIGTHFRSTEAKRTALHDFAPQVELDDGGWSWGLLSAKPQPAHEQFDEVLIGVPVEDMLSRYRELVATGSALAYGELMRDWLRANPAGAETLAGLLRDGEFEAEQAARAGVFYALGSANTAEAQAVLVSFLGPADQVRHQVAAAHALALVDAPTPEMVELLSAASLREGLHPVDRSSMALALGSLAHSSEQRDPELAAIARNEIHTWLSNPDDAHDIGASLLAAGNAGHDEFVPDIARYLADEDPSVRRDATHALRQMSPEQALPQIEAQAFDDDRVVRTSAFETATAIVQRHDQAPPEAMIEAAGSALPDAGQAEERAALRLLGEAAKRGNPRADQLLRERLSAQLDGQRDPARLAALGRQLPGSWRAPN